MTRYQEIYTFEERLAEATNVRNKFPDRVPVIVETIPKTSYKQLDKSKYLVPQDLSLGKFIYVIRKRLQLKPEQSLFVFIGKEAPPTGELMSNLYAKHKKDDGFLYLLYGTEDTFG
ncbi:MAG: ubiquitin family protein [Nitrososphaerales archaeon]